MFDTLPREPMNAHRPKRQSSLSKKRGDVLIQVVIWEAWVFKLRLTFILVLS
jgi:hypothetical protein